MPPQKALEAIAMKLQKQYEQLQPRARYKQSLDPTVEEVKKLCVSLRRNAHSNGKPERILFHYNGHGVPKPTVNGELWVFNKSYTQYIPLSLYDLQQWVATPAIYVYDCSNAGQIVESFNQFSVQRERELDLNIQQSKMEGVEAAAVASEITTVTNNNTTHETASTTTSNGIQNDCNSDGSNISQSEPRKLPLPQVPLPSEFKRCIQLAACGKDELLPMNPDLPADLFTSCLTTPIKIALQWFIKHNSGKLLPGVTAESLEKIPGQLSDRRTMLGELNWIFTAITDTIAWNVLPKKLFQELFRQDLLVASLFRNFLLADRIMRSYNCTPVSSPELPSTCHHPMWQAWDLAVDSCLCQLPRLLTDSTAVYEHSNFFSEQLTAFQVWLNLGNHELSPPEQLPIVLQVLLSQVHRLRALDLLSRFLDLGPWAVSLVSVSGCP
jgi:regulator-associated protein of mTOR